MRELNTVEIAEVSGAGKIQDNLTSFLESAFSGFFNAFTPLSDLGYTEDEFSNAGKELGQRIGGAIENKINQLIDALNSLVG